MDINLTRVWNCHTLTTYLSIIQEYCHGCVLNKKDYRTHFNSALWYERCFFKHLETMGHCNARHEDRPLRNKQLGSIESVNYN